MDSSDSDDDLRLFEQLCAKGQTHQKTLAPPTAKRRMEIKSAWDR
jgi:hypothetical protein